MEVAALLVDGFQRVAEAVDRALDGMPSGSAAAEPEPGSNSVAWLVWHLTRVQDDHLAAAFGVEQLWTAQGWADRFDLPFPASDIGFGHDQDQARQVRPHPELLGAYHRAVLVRTPAMLAELTPGALDRVVDTRWSPPVTLGVRLVSVLADDLQHAGQAGYVRGLLERRGGGSWSAV